MKKYRNLLSFLAIFILVQSCTTPAQDTEMQSNESPDYVRLHIINDSTIVLDSIHINISELYSELNKRDASNIDKVYITAERSVNMGKVIDIELILGELEIPLIVYPFNNEDSLTKKLVPAPDKKRLIDFELDKSGELFYGGNQIINSEDIIPAINSDLNRIEVPIIYLNTKEGIGYQDYVEQKNRINRELIKIDSSLKITETSWGHYIEIKE